MYRRCGKRALDVLGATLLLLLASPLLALAALAVLLALGRPVLFRQERAGQDGKPFQVLKLRSMRDGRAMTLPGSPASAAPCGPARWMNCHNCGMCCAAR